VIIIIFLLTSLIGVRLGLEVICRTALTFFPWIVALLFILFLFLLPETKIENIQPILGEGMRPIIKGSFQCLGLPYLELAIILMITPYVTEKAKMKKAFYKGTLIGGFLLTILIMISILVLGPDLTARQDLSILYVSEKNKHRKFFRTD
jgi:spore germination protein KB